MREGNEKDRREYQGRQEGQGPAKDRLEWDIPFDPADDVNAHPDWWGDHAHLGDDDDDDAEPDGIVAELHHHWIKNGNG